MYVFHIPLVIVQRNYSKQRNYLQRSAQNYPQLEVSPGAVGIIMMAIVVYMCSYVNILKAFDGFLVTIWFGKFL